MNETQYQLYGVLPDTARSIWRYMDLAKYLSLLHSNALFFSQTKNLEDPYEGSLTLGPAGDFPGSDLDKYLRETQVYEYGPRSYTFVSCWHFNEIESAAMWQLYGYRNQGIAVRSSIDRLCQSMDISSVKGQIYVGSIVYGKVDNEPLAGDPAGRSETMDIFHKRPSFSHENEFRVVVDLIEHKQERLAAEQHGGMSIPVDLNTLIEAVYVAPHMPSWTFELIRHLTSDVFKLPVGIIKSDLMNKPPY